MSCCSPAPISFGAPATAAFRSVHTAPAQLQQAIRDAAMPIPGGRAEVGTDQPYLPNDGEGPRRFVRVQPFRLGATAVTNAEFAAFVADTGHVTDAERFGWSFVFYQHVDGIEDTTGVVGAEWWRRIDGAYWRNPAGPRSTISGREAEPVTHVSWNDAAAFAAWAGGRLPTEAEWEQAARGGLTGSIYPWGNRHPDDAEFFPCNIWQGEFPRRNTGADGFPALAPARSYAPNGYGLYNMSGNCWEWTADNYRIRSLASQARAADANARAAGWKLLKGGSFLCHQSYCHRYRIAARTGNTPDSTTGHMGFRVAFDA
jgi:formylglycine-generating enzyme required for sulfatase activity